MKYFSYALYIVYFFIFILLPYIKNLKNLPLKIKTLQKKSHIIFEVIHFIGYSSLIILFIPIVISPIYFIDYLNYDGYYALIILCLLTSLLGFAFKK